ncbi:MAG TPA: ABC transporter substrate-binding protein [Bryobacteraceae bacterium]|nr:ABC transporter substrate-binding protein [Bryobacteraceae bacterium]
MSFSLRLAAALVAFVAANAAPPPQRIVSASPNVTEILYGVGAFNRVVGVTEFCTYPPEAKKLPRIGGWESNNLEAVVALRPDIVILTEPQAPFMESQLQKLGLHTLAVPSQRLDDVFKAIAMIGRVTGHETQAAELEKDMRAKLDAVRNRTSKLPRRRVLLVVDRTPGTLRDLIVATKGSFLADLLVIAGGECVGEPSNQGYERISKEAIVALDPDLVVDFVHGSKDRMGEDPQAVWRDLHELRAVRDGRVYPVRDDFLPHASQLVDKTAELFAHILHPEAGR